MVKYNTQFLNMLMLIILLSEEIYRIFALPALKYIINYIKSVKIVSYDVMIFLCLNYICIKYVTKSLTLKVLYIYIYFYLVYKYSI